MLARAGRHRAPAGLQGAGPGQGGQAWGVGCGAAASSGHVRCSPALAAMCSQARSFATATTTEPPPHRYHRPPPHHARWRRSAPRCASTCARRRSSCCRCCWRTLRRGSRRSWWLSSCAPSRCPPWRCALGWPWPGAGADVRCVVGGLHNQAVAPQPATHPRLCACSKCWAGCGARCRRRSRRRCGSSCAAWWLTACCSSCCWPGWHLRARQAQALSQTPAALRQQAAAAAQILWLWTAPRRARSRAPRRRRWAPSRAAPPKSLCAAGTRRAARRPAARARPRARRLPPPTAAAMIASWRMQGWRPATSRHYGCVHTCLPALCSHRGRPRHTHAL